MAGNIPNGGNGTVRLWRPNWILASVAAGSLLAAGLAHALLTGAPSSRAAAPLALATAPPPFSGLAAGPLAQQSYTDFRNLRGPRNVMHEFYFTRAIYTSWGGRGRRGRGGSWSTDYPKADIQFLWGLKRLTNIDAYDSENAVMLTDPDIRRYPFLYALEVGYMQLTPPEVEALRSYLFAGGFLFIDDFWGTWEWDNFQFEIHKVLPEYEIVELPLDHPLFRTFYVIDEIKQVPQVGYAWYGGNTWEKDGYTPYVRAIFDDDGRLLVLINWNTDLGDAWEWAENPYYPLDLSTFAYQLATNAIIYAMSH